MRQLVGAVQLVQAHHPAAHRVALLLALLLGGCAIPQKPQDGVPPRPANVPTGPPVAPKPNQYGFREDVGYARSAEEVSGAAVISLLSRARTDLSAGRVEQAVDALETALQIEKRNPFVWQQLARAHLQRFQPEDAEIARVPLQLVGLGILLDGLGLVLMHALLGAGATGLVMKVSVGFQWLLFLPIAYVLGPMLGYGLTAVWLGMTLYRSLQTGVFVLAWQRREWVHIKL